MLEKMGEFFDSRLAMYDEHQLTAIESARELYRFTAERLPGAGRARGCSIWAAEPGWSWLRISKAILRRGSWESTLRPACWRS